jgi:ribosomal protein S18 acetylase RimI-like enzyme
MKDLTIRKATIDDLAALLELEQGIIAAERPFNGTIKNSDCTYYNLNNFIFDDDAYLLVAVINNKIIASGYAQLRISRVSLKHDHHAYLGFMYVAEKYRGMGINKQLTDRLIKWSKGRGLTDFYLDVYIENVAAIRAYEKAGFSKSMLEMKLNLNE